MGPARAVIGWQKRTLAGRKCARRTNSNKREIQFNYSHPANSNTPNEMLIGETRINRSSENANG